MAERATRDDADMAGGAAGDVDAGELQEELLPWLVARGSGRRWWRLGGDEVARTIEVTRDARRREQAVVADLGEAVR